MCVLCEFEAKAKYGDRGSSGALEFTGKNTKTLGLRGDVRFPPPPVEPSTQEPDLEQAQQG